MGFLLKAAREESSSDENDQLEEQYMRLFPKIGRDFIHREDFENIIKELLRLIDPAGLSTVDTSDDSEARSRAKEYKIFLEDDKKGSDVYRDLINLDEEGEETE